jgi:hypothetical protein
VYTVILIVLTGDENHAWRWTILQKDGSDSRSVTSYSHGSGMAG